MSSSDSAASASSPDSSRHDSWQGLAYGVGAYGLWGVIPLYFRLVREFNPLEVLAHRAIWSFLLLLGLVAIFGKLPTAWRTLRQPSASGALVASSLLIAANWLTYIYAVGTEQIVQASLGYFITPLANALLGLLILGERLRRLQVVALAFAVLGVLVLAIRLNQIPWISLSLAVTFSLYGLLRKTMQADSLVGLFAETMFLSPVALAYLAWLAWNSAGVFQGVGARHEVLLILSGPVTCAPLLLFASAARNLRLTTLGFLQFLAPMIQFLLAVFLFGEEFGPSQQIAFSLIWLAVLIYIADSVLRTRRGVAL